MPSAPSSRKPRRGRDRRRQAALGSGAAVLATSVLVIGYLALNGGERPRLTQAEAPPASATPEAPTTTTLPPGVSEIAESIVAQVKVFDDPVSRVPRHSFDHPWHLNDDPSAPTVPLVFLVEEKRDNGWLRVLLPTRPNGSTGWVRTNDVKLTTNPYHIDVALGAHLITVYNGLAVVYQGRVATGTPQAPTPPGKYYIRVLLQTTNPRSAYGPFAYGLSAHSDVLTSFNGGDAEVGIHGNNDASVLGKSVTHGCVRMDNEEITQLAKLLPLGTSVQIDP